MLCTAAILVDHLSPYANVQQQQADCIATIIRSMLQQSLPLLLLASDSRLRAVRASRNHRLKALEEQDTYRGALTYPIQLTPNSVPNRSVAVVVEAHRWTRSPCMPHGLWSKAPVSSKVPVDASSSGPGGSFVLLPYLASLQQSPLLFSATPSDTLTPLLSC